MRLAERAHGLLELALQLRLAPRRATRRAGLQRLHAARDELVAPLGHRGLRALAAPRDLRDRRLPTQHAEHDLLLLRSAEHRRTSHQHTPSSIGTSQTKLTTVPKTMARETPSGSPPSRAAARSTSAAPPPAPP